jgi:hypothetical protein
VDGEQQGIFWFRLDMQELGRVLPLLACFEPDSIRSLKFMFCFDDLIAQPVLTALGAALSTTGGGGYAAVSGCHTLTLSTLHGFQDDAACAALLPMLMATHITTVDCGYTHHHPASAWLVTACCPDSLAAVTRPITLRLCCEPGVLQQVQAAVAAAGKAELVHLQCDR